MGAQVHARLSIILFAHQMHLQYVHKPFTTFKRNEPNLQGSIADAWEQFFNLGFGEMSLSDIGDVEVLNLSSRQIDSVPWKANTLYVVPHCHLFADYFPDLYSTLLRQFRVKYGASPKPEICYFIDSKVNVAVHVRRGDLIGVNGTLRHPQRFTTNAAIMKRLNYILLMLKGLGMEASVHLFSDGHPAGFAEFEDAGVALHVMDSAFVTFHHLAMVDILLMAKSSFSYVAALLSKGIKVYEDFWHSPLSEWLVVDQGSQQIDEVKFKRQLHLYAGGIERRPVHCRFNLHRE